MDTRPKEITLENVLEVDIVSIAQDRRFPELKFENAQTKLVKIQRWFIEAKELSYDELLVPSDISIITGYIDRLRGYLVRLLQFDTETTVQNATEVHNNLESEIDSYYNEVYQQIAMRILPFLRQEVARGSSDTQELEKQQKETLQAKKEYLELKDNIAKELDDIKARRSEVESKQGEFVAIGLGKDFEDQSKKYEQDAKGWLDLRSKWFMTLLIIVGVNLVGYFVLFVTNKINVWPYLDPKDFFTLQYALVKIAVLILLSYAVGFCSRNYNISSGLSATNRHRKNVAETLLNALSSNMNDEAKGEITRDAASAMFKHLPVGYIHKEHQNDSGPILEIVKKISSKGE